MKLRMIAESIPPVPSGRGPLPGPQPPLAKRLGEMVKSGKLKAAQVFPDGSYHLHRYYGITDQDKAQLVKFGAWYQDETGDWILDVRKVPGALGPTPPPIPGKPGMAGGARPTGTPAGSGMTPGFKMVITKLVAALKSKKIDAMATTSGTAMMQHAGLTDQEFAMLKRTDLLKKDPEGFGYSVDTAKLGEVRRQNGIN